MRENGRYLGPPAAVPFLRTRGLLRFVEKQARDQAFPVFTPSADSFHRAGRILGVVLRGQDVAWRTRRSVGIRPLVSPGQFCGDYFG